MPRYSQQFRDQAVELYLTSGASIKKISAELGISYDTLSKWVRDAKQAEQGLDITERERLKNAEKELLRLREENQILKKAAAFLAIDQLKS